MNNVRAMCGRIRPWLLQKVLRLGNKEEYKTKMTERSMEYGGGYDEGCSTAGESSYLAVPDSFPHY